MAPQQTPCTPANPCPCTRLTDPPGFLGLQGGRLDAGLKLVSFVGNWDELGILRNTPGILPGMPCALCMNQTSPSSRPTHPGILKAPAHYLTFLWTPLSSRSTRGAVLGCGPLFHYPTIHLSGSFQEADPVFSPAFPTGGRMSVAQSAPSPCSSCYKRLHSSPWRKKPLSILSASLKV